MPGPFLYQNQCAAFIELVFPLAVYQSLVDRRHSLVYMTIAAGMFATVIAAVSRAGVARLAAELTNGDFVGGLAAGTDARVKP